MTVALLSPLGVEGYRQAELVFEATDLLRKLSALIPPPRSRPALELLVSNWPAETGHVVEWASRAQRVTRDSRTRLRLNARPGVCHTPLSMGLFDRLFRSKGRREAESEARAVAEPPPPTWAERLSKAALSGRESIPLVRELFGEVGTCLEGPFIKEPDTGSDSHIELRGTLDGIPMKLEIGVLGLFVARCRLEQAPPETVIGWDPSQVPTAADPGDPWADQDEQRVFIGKGVSVSGTPEKVQARLRTIRRLPEDFVAELCAAMASIGIVEFTSYTSGGHELALTYTPIYQSDTPIGVLRDGFGLLRKSAAVFNALPRSEVPRDTATEPVRCSYCGTVFVLARASRCPNCGAPYGT